MENPKLGEKIDYGSLGNARMIGRIVEIDNKRAGVLIGARVAVEWDEPAEIKGQISDWIPASALNRA